MNERALYDRFHELKRQRHCVFETDAGEAVTSPGMPLWIRLREGTDARPFFCAFLREWPGALHQLVAEGEAARACAQAYAHKTGAAFTTKEMVAYMLPGEVGLPDGGGVLHLPETVADCVTVLQWIKLFREEAFGEVPPPIREEGVAPPQGEAYPPLYLWQSAPGGVPMAMGSISPGEDIRRLNLVFTPKENRRKGYGRALVAALCGVVRGEGKMPVLYTYGDNTGAMRLYAGLGFVEAGRLVEVTFIRP
ncbi:MAG: GNAT family N-acetyltransferase [Defluviitaleaceae bacterium]|nr:GNAT family N-acetyltransferase [Defluviitaleaceae bacterium]MCL2240341.1 GNAT family N-acetyltransferase [Defluviitaleaceae bacterium]